MKKKPKNHFPTYDYAGIRKILNIMKLALLLLTIGLCNIFASTFSQSIRLDLKLYEVSLISALADIEDKTDLKFLYRPDLINLEKSINLEIEETTIDDLMSSLLKDTRISYTVINSNLIVLSPLQQQKITGTITDETTGEPLPGVYVVIKGTNTGVVSDAHGNFNIAISNMDDILMFSFIGYLGEEVPVTGQSVIDVKLTPDITTLEEVVVVGYGTMKKTDLTGAVASIDGSNLTKVSAANISTAIAGRLSGLQVTQVSGEPGASALLRMRGIGSVYSDNSPLVVIDGFVGNMSQINPNEVESVSLLKDAASASIYGSRAANGVVLITTKRGTKNQPFKLELSSQIGFQQATNLPKLLDSKEWCKKMNEATLARSGTEYWIGDQAPELQTTNTNWLDYIFRTAPIQDYNISATGGAEKLRYAVNIGYMDQDGIIIEENYKRASLRASVDYTGDFFSIGANISQFRSWNKSTISRENALINAFRTPPTIPVYNPDNLPGTPRTGYDGEEIKDLTPSMDALSREYLKQFNSSTANLYMELNLWKGLKYRTVFNARTGDYFTTTFNPVWSSYRPEDTEHTTIYRGNATAYLYNSDETTYLWEIQNLLTYTLDLKSHHIDALLGASAQKGTSDDFWASKTGFSRNTLDVLNAGSDNPLNGGTTGVSSIYSQFGRLNYSFMDKYLMQVNLRRDGSSAFARGNRWGLFPSVSVGWRVSEEEFLKRNPVVSNLKLRAGYGTLGNSSIPSYKWLSTISFGSSYVFGTGQNLHTGTRVTGAYNENISWEKTTTINAGIDMGLLDNKISLTFDYFNRHTTDMLLLQPLPNTAGFSGNPYVNLGGVDNKGWEFSAEYNNRFNDLKYGLSFNLTHLKNKVVDMGGLNPIIDTYSRTMEGEAIGSFYGYVVEGIYQNQDDIDNHAALTDARPGDFKFKDVNPDGIIDDKDRKVLGNAIPKFYYGFNVFLNWKGFDLSAMLQGEMKKKIMMEPAFGMDFGVLYDYANMYEEVYDKRWKGEGDDSYYPALGSGIRTINNQTNDRWLHNASYMRLKSLQIGYTLPEKITSKFQIDHLRIFMTGTNLLTFTKYPGFDPEIGNSQKRADSSGYMDQVYTRGGTDYPQAKTFTMGVSVTF